MRKATAISIRADKAYINAVNAYANEQGKTTADLMRDLLDQHLGAELAPLVTFFASRDRNNVQSAVKKVKRNVA